MAQLANKCGNEDIEFFIKESGEILGAPKGKGSNGTRDAMEVLFHVFQKLVDFKKLNQEQAPYSSDLGTLHPPPSANEIYFNSPTLFPEFIPRIRRHQLQPSRCASRYGFCNSCCHRQRTGPWRPTRYCIGVEGCRC